MAFSLSAIESIERNDEAIKTSGKADGIEKTSGKLKVKFGDKPKVKVAEELNTNLGGKAKAMRNLQVKIGAKPKAKVGGK